MSRFSPRATTLHFVLAATLFSGGVSAQPKAPQSPAAPPATPAPSASAPAAAPPVDLIARGQQQFEDQQYEESIQTLSAALLRPGSTQAQKIAVYRLLALNYITLRRPEEAESAVRGLLAIQPDYDLPSEESPRFRDFFAEVRKKWEAEGRPGLVVGQAKPVEQVLIKHSAPTEAEARSSLALRAQLDDKDGRVIVVKVFYRAGSKNRFQERTATIAPGDDGMRRVMVNIPGDSVKPPILEYFLQAFDAGGIPVGSRGDDSDPIRVVVPEPASKAWVWPVAIGGGVLGVAAVFGTLALAGVFSSTTTQPQPQPQPTPGRSTVTIIVGN